MSYNVGALTATLGFRVDDEGAARFDRKIKTLRGEVAKPVTAELKADLNPHDLNLYEKKLKDIRGQVAKREQFKAQLGANYDARAFRAYESELKKASAEAEKAAKKISADAEKVALQQRKTSAGYVDASRKVTRATDDNVRAQGRLRTAFGSVYGRGGAVFAAAGGLYGVGRAMLYGVKTGADFETQMARVQGVLGLSGRDGERARKQLEKLAIQLGRDTKFSASEAADAMYELASAGFQTGQMAKVLPGTLSLAAASGIELADAAEISSNALNGFGLAGSKSQHVADVLAQSVNSSSVEMKDLQLSLKYIGPIAQLTGQSFEDMIAAVSAMGDAGIKGEQAGTSLRGGLIRLVKPTDSVTAGLDAIGVKAEQLQGPKGLKPLPQLMGILAKHTEGMSKAARAQALTLIFGTEAASGMSTALNVGEKQLRKTSQAFKDSDGASKQAATTMNKTVAGAWDNFRGSVDTALIRVYDFIKIPLRKFLMDAADWANRAGEKIVVFIGQMRDGTGAGGKFVAELKEIAAQAKAIGTAIYEVGKFLHDHIGLVKLAATAWIGYKVAALGAAAASKAAGLAALLAARRAGGGAAAGAAGVAAGAGAGRLSRFAGAAGGASGVVVAAGGIKAISDAIHGASASDLGLLDQYAKRISALAKAGDAGGMQKLAAQLRETAKANADTTKGDHLKAFASALDLTAKSGGRDLSALQAAFKAMAKSSGGDLEKVRADMLKTKQSAGFNFGAVGEETREVKHQFRLMQLTTDNSMAAIQDVVHRNSLRIKQNLGKNSAEGKEALASNFRQAAKAVKTQMAASGKVTKEGMQAIRGYLVQELRVYGLGLSQARNIVKGGGHGRDFGDPDANRGREGGAGLQSGGWLGRRGMVGSDTIPVAPGYWAAPGEYFAKGPGGRGAVINRHQAPIVDLALMAGGHTLDTLPRDSSALPRIEAALSPLGGLDSLFAAITRPHMLQGGGSIIPVPGFPGESAAARVIPAIEAIAHRFGLVLTDAFGPGHKSPGHTRFGTAADFAGSDAAMDAAVRYLVGQGYLVGYDGRFGSQAWPGHGPSTVAGGNAHLHVELGGKGGVLAQVAQIPGVRIRGGGAVGRAVQGALGLARGAAQSMLGRASSSALSTPVAGGGTGGLSKGQLAALWMRANGGLGNPNLMAAIAMAESGGRAVVNSIGATGYWQIHPGGPQYLPGLANARAAGQKLRTQGPRAWEAFTNGSYRRFLQGGGRTGPNTASGVGNTSGPGQAGPPPYSIGRNRRRARSGIKAYDDALADVETYGSDYEYWDRRYGLSEETLITPDGDVDKAAVAKRARELARLIKIRERIVKAVDKARKAAIRAARAYEQIVRRLRGSLKHAKRKERKGIRNQIKNYAGKAREMRGNAGEQANALRFARLDLREIRQERAEVLGTTPETQDTTPTDTGDTGAGDMGGPGITTDQQAQLDQAQQLKDIVTRGDYANAAALRTLGVFAPSFNPNTVGQQGVGGAGGSLPASRSVFSAGGVSAQPMVVNNIVQFTSPLKPTPQEAMAVAGIVNAGNSYRGSVSSPRVNLGV